MTVMYQERGGGGFFQGEMGVSFVLKDIRVQKRKKLVLAQTSIF